MSTLRAKEGFEEYYATIFGDRWKTLQDSLAEEPSYIEWKESSDDAYYLDSASVRAAYSLPVNGAKNILDMCAAPGGKSLVLAHRMDRDALLLCNERSASRRTRLSHVLDNHLPEDIRKRVKISANDGSLMCKKEVTQFDAILLDAPCSSERHVLLDEKYLNQWSSARIKNLAMAQWSLLSSAYRLLKEGGYLLYATCALTTSENDDVIKKLFKKFDTAELAPVNNELVERECRFALPNSEKTEFGYHVLPDTQQGAGPLYYSLIHKKI